MIKGHYFFGLSQWSFRYFIVEGIGNDWKTSGSKKIHILDVFSDIQQDIDVLNVDVLQSLFKDGKIDVLESSLCTLFPYKSGWSSILYAN